MCRWDRVDRNGPNLHAIGAIHVEGAVGTERRSWELAVTTPDSQIASGIGDRQARARPGPSASRERLFSWAGGIAVTCEQAPARDERHNTHTCKPSSHTPL